MLDTRLSRWAWLELAPANDADAMPHLLGSFVDQLVGLRTTRTLPLGPPPQ